MLPVMALTAAMLLWSSAFISLKYLLDFLHPTQIVFLRMLMASGCFLICYKQLRHFQYQAGDWKWLTVMLLAEPCLYFLFEATALQYTTAGQAGVITATLPLLGSIAAFLLLKEKIGRFQILGFIVAILGCVILSWTSTSGEHASNPVLGNFLEFCAMMCGAIYSVSIRKLSARYSAWVLTSLQAFIGMIFFGPFAFQHAFPAEMGLQQWGCLIYLATLVTIGAYWFYNWSVSKMPVSLAVAYINLIPVFTLILAYLILNEQLSMTQCIACLIVFTGVILSQMPVKQSEPLPEVV